MVLDKLPTRAVQRTTSLMISRWLRRKMLVLAAPGPGWMIFVPPVLGLEAVTTVEASVIIVGALV